MIRLGMILGIARAEARLTRRLVRFWVFTALSWLVAGLIFTQWMFIHWLFSSWSATAATINPRYLIGGMGVWYMMIFSAGLVFLGFDVRARDTRERVVDVLDARPCTNIELLLGKLLGLMIPSWIPVVGLCLLLALVGRLLEAPMEPWSMIALCTAMILPMFVFIVALVYLVTLAVRHRGIAAVLLVGMVVGLFVLVFRSPIYLMPVLDFTGSYIVDFPSDILPGIADIPGWFQRFAVMLLGLGLIWIAAAVHPRKDGVAPARRLAIGGGMIVVAAAICVGSTMRMVNGMRDQAAWTQAHEAVRDEPAPDLLEIKGHVIVDPGREIRESLTMKLAAPPDQSLSEAIFSLNPGIEVSSLRSAEGAELQFTHQDGLLRVSLPQTLESGQTMELQLEAAGEPNIWFAYLDGVIDPMKISPWDGQIFLLGFLQINFDSRFVALMPGARWLPASGSEIGRGDPEVRPEDLHHLDLTVEFPEGWLAAGPARRQQVDPPSGESGRSAYRFNPPAPVPEVAVIAGQFESRSIELDGVTLEVLVHPAHLGSVEFFDDAKSQIRDWLTQRMSEAANSGLAYPYDSLSLVEVPTTLRGFSGGWRMDTAMVQPGMMLMRENSFPTARFDVPFKDESSYKDKEGGVPKAKLDMVLRFFENDFNGGNPFIGAARSYFGYVTSAAGRQGLPLDFVCEDLSTRLVSEKRGYFSAHLFDSNINQIIGESIVYITSGRRGGRSVTESIIASMTSNPDVWEAALDASLEDLDPWEDPKRAINVLTLKGGAMAASMLDEMGSETTGKMLAAVRKTESSEVSRDSMIEAASQVGVDLEPWLNLWIEQTDLPGFSSGEVELFRIKDADDGSPRYQLLITVQNDEPTPGLVRLQYRVGRRGPRGGGPGGGGQGGGQGGGPGRGFDPTPPESTDPVRVDGESAVQIGVVTSEVPRGVRVAPYFSLNRESFLVDLPEVDEDETVDREPFVGSRPAKRSNSDEGIILVDDLDSNFSLEGEPARSFLQLAGRGVKVQMDHGVPMAPPGQMPRNWSRRVVNDAHGRYRHTVALVRKGTGLQKAVFTAEIPRPGRFRLETHMTQRFRRGNRLGTWNYGVETAGETQEVTFDAANAEAGWNSLGEFELDAGEVRVSISDLTDKTMVFADAIRWVPVVAGDVAQRSTR